MNKSYRNTIEIARYAEQITNVTGLEFLERHGKAVEAKNGFGYRWSAPGHRGTSALKKEWSADQRSFF